MGPRLSPIIACPVAMVRLENFAERGRLERMQRKPLVEVTAEESFERGVRRESRRGHRRKQHDDEEQLFQNLTHNDLDSAV